MYESREIKEFKEHQAPTFSWNKEVARGKTHFVQFYESDSFLIQSIRDFFLICDTGIIIATAEHIEKIKNTALEYSSKIIFLEVAETLSLFMIDGLPNTALFAESIGMIVKKACQRGEVRAFGEMVSVLWAEGNQQAAIKLEALWNDLQNSLSFSLLCAYPLRSFNDHSHAQSFELVCSHHTHVVPAESYNHDSDTGTRLRTIASLQQKATSLEAELKKTKILESQKNDFLALASHELKTPLTSIKIYEQVLREKFEEKNDSQAVAYLFKMDTQINKLSSLVNDLLDITRIQSDRLKFNNSNFDIALLLSEVANEMQLTTSQHTIEVDIRHHTNVFADHDRISQVLTHLLSNAIKYSPDHNKIIVGCEHSGTSVRIWVQDFGIGIHPSSQLKIFEQFFRADDPQIRTFPGLGLGLYISKQIMERQNSTLKVESAKGEGSIFSFTLPE